MSKAAKISSKPTKGFSIVLFVPDYSILDSNNERSVVVFNSNIPSNVEFYIKFVSPQKSTFVKADRINDTTILFTPPGSFPPGLASVSIHHGTNQHLLCKYASQFFFKTKLEVVSTLLSSATDPISFIASAYKLNKKDGVAIDFMLERSFKMNCPNQVQKLKETTAMQTNNTTGNSNLSNPTLLHFAARYNFVRLCIALLDCPGSSTSLDITNNKGETPIDLAENSGNKELAQTMTDSKNNKGTNNADEIYEHMSGEVFDRYKEMKNNFDEVYEKMSLKSDETYEKMFPFRRESGKSRQLSTSADRHSTYSSESADSTASTDSRGSSSSHNNIFSTSPPVPYASYKRNSKPTIANPLLHELRKRTEEKRQSFSYENNEPICTTSPKSPLKRQQYEQVDLPLNLDNNSDFYDVPSSLVQTERQTYGAPIHPVCATTSQRYSINDEDYDEITRKNRSSTSTPDEEDEVYDTPGNRTSVADEIANPLLHEPRKRTEEKRQSFSYESNEPICTTSPKSPLKRQQYEQVDLHLSLDNNSDVYDVPSSLVQTERQTYGTPIQPVSAATSLCYSINDEDYDEITTTNRSSTSTHDEEDEVYDTPGNRTSVADETYDVPPPSMRHSSQASLNDDTPTSPASIKRYSTSNDINDALSRHSTCSSPKDTKENTVIKPPRSKFNLPKSTISQSISADNLALDEVYDVVFPLNKPVLQSPGHKNAPVAFPSFDEPPPGAFQRNRKRYSEPSLTLNPGEQTRLIAMKHRQPLLPPPCLPPRNTAIANGQLSSPPPVPPPRR